MEIILFKLIHEGNYLTLYYIEKKDIRIALCTMGKEENLYMNEFVE